MEWSGMCGASLLLLRMSRRRAAAMEWTIARDASYDRPPPPTTRDTTRGHRRRGPVLPRVIHVHCIAITSHHIALHCIALHATRYARYIVVAFPYRESFSAEARDAWDTWELLIDVFFCADVFVNLRTGFVSQAEPEVGRETMACRIRIWRLTHDDETKRYGLHPPRCRRRRPRGHEERPARAQEQPGAARDAARPSGGRTRALVVRPQLRVGEGQGGLGRHGADRGLLGVRAVLVRDRRGELGAVGSAHVPRPRRER